MEGGHDLGPDCNEQGSIVVVLKCCAGTSQLQLHAHEARTLIGS